MCEELLQLNRNETVNNTLTNGQRTQTDIFPKIHWSTHTREDADITNHCRNSNRNHGETHFASARTAVGSQNTAGAGRGAEGSDLTGAEAAVCTGRPGRAPLGGVRLGPLAPPGADAALTGACSSALASAFFMEPPSRGMRSIFPVWAKSKWVPGGRGITAGGTEGPW